MSLEIQGSEVLQKAFQGVQWKTPFPWVRMGVTGLSLRHPKDIGRTEIRRCKLTSKLLQDWLGTRAESPNRHHPVLGWGWWGGVVGVLIEKTKPQPREKVSNGDWPRGSAEAFKTGWATSISKIISGVPDDQQTRTGVLTSLVSVVWNTQVLVSWKVSLLQVDWKFSILRCDLDPQTGARAPGGPMESPPQML